MNFYSDEQEWQWLFKSAIDWKTIIPLYFPTFPTEEGLNSPEEVISFLEELLGQTGEWTAGAVSNRAKEMDKHHAGIVENGKTVPNEYLSALYRECVELGIFGLSVPKKYGGMELPFSMNLTLFAQISRACLSSCTQIAFFTSIADMLDRFGPAQFKDKYIPKIVQGEISGAMCLTEPGAGSDVGAIKTTAVLQANGNYRITGTKAFITNGGGGLGYVLARIKGEPEGLEGISMFFVEQEIDGENGTKIQNYKVTKNEDKMGLHGSFTCEIVYENTLGYLVGEKNMGFHYMLHLMNEARLAVGLQALGTIEGSLYHARIYAEERIQFGVPLVELPLYKRNLQDYETERDALRALIVDTISHYDIFQKLDQLQKDGKELTKEEKKILKDAYLWTRKRTPLVKYYSCEIATNLSQRAIQMLGGYGFMQEYPVERYHRDSFAPLLYEGTSQVQALMALKDIVKYAIKDPSRFFANIFFKHPIGAIINKESEITKKYTTYHYTFKKRFIKLLIKCLRPQMGKIFNPKAWMEMDRVNILMAHAETVCQALSYMETLRVLCYHANQDNQRRTLFTRYEKLIAPRLEAIYKDWSMEAR
ncbi:MAG: hypothetical protein A2381_20020 [Bdellovibrionales bacterium RIFOXYB1_FULL_37_110]|nr:MAG: hypothetical protein A2181_03655 [Bdellovibrionales bacterium RIFOXYA1_FULL_38_20]OFZ51025.1 MAG: hypothetical protein A2417_19805 [Bdellovibrionales bacterium RIFOXYC1_FULL_37_79]OFZ60237.1 MAG: hypothetical protein A2381_20020 [Bdellovibrionales bacterium RIFOXYB1_FULL_37_110]OFZ63232.1 MAG: hypothetical protein A2577_01335 [Bdellovibrionales bacterium RIFOXYD1_FULL_36_51]